MMLQMLKSPFSITEEDHWEQDKHILGNGDVNDNLRRITVAKCEDAEREQERAYGANV